MDEFESFLEMLAKYDEVQRIIPWRIARRQSGSSHEVVSLSYKTTSGCKLIMKKGATAQEVFVVFDEQHRIVIQERLTLLWVKNVE